MMFIKLQRWIAELCPFQWRYLPTKYIVSDLIIMDSPGCSDTGNSQQACCFNCNLNISREGLVHRECPIYLQNNDSLKIQIKSVCPSCMDELNRIENYVEENQIVSCDTKFQSEVIQHLQKVDVSDVKNQRRASNFINGEERGRSISQSATIGSRKFAVNSPKDKTAEAKSGQTFYSSFALDHMKQISLSLLVNVPKNIQYFLYLSSKHRPQGSKKLVTASTTSTSSQYSTLAPFITPQERHQKHKSVMFYLVERCALSVQEMQVVSLIVMVLLCHMDCKKIYPIMAELSHLAVKGLIDWRLIANYKEVKEEALEDQFGRKAKKNNKIMAVQKLWPKIELLLKLRNLNQQQFVEAYSKLIRLDSSLSCRDYQKQLSLLQGKHPDCSILSGRSTASQLANYYVLELYKVKMQRNNYLLVLKTLLSQQESIHKHVNAIEHKHKMEKQEFISKIVKLNNRIEALQKQLINRDNNALLLDEKDLLLGQTKKGANLLEMVEAKEKTNKHKHGIQTIQEEKEPANDVDEESLTYLQSIITMTGLLNFNEKLSFLAVENKASYSHPHLHTKISAAQSKAEFRFERLQPKNVCQRIVNQINKFQQGMDKLLSKYRTSQDEKARLLGILSRKEERFVSLIVQKDTIIERYQNALWKMQNKLQVTEEPLSHRIKYIMSLYKSEPEIKLEAVSSPLRKKVSPLASLAGDKQAQSEKKKKDQDKKDCQIY